MNEMRQWGQGPLESLRPLSAKKALTFTQSEVGSQYIYWAGECHEIIYVLRVPHWLPGLE